MPIPRKFSAARLREARGGLSVLVVAGHAGVTGQTVRNWEQGRGVPSANALAVIAALTERPIDWFFVEESAA